MLTTSYRQQLSHGTNKENLDRFIPNRSAMDMAYAHYMLTDGRLISNKQQQNRSEYRKLLDQAFNMNGRRILALAATVTRRPATLVAVTNKGTMDIIISKLKLLDCSIPVRRRKRRSESSVCGLA